MSTFITRGSTVITPTVVLGFQSDRSSGNLIHNIPGRANPDITARPANLQTGTLSLGFAGPTAEADAKAAVDAHASTGVFSLVSDDRPTVAMYYVTNGTITRALDDESRDAWVVTIAFQEVSL